MKTISILFLLLALVSCSSNKDHQKKELVTKQGLVQDVDPTLPKVKQVEMISKQIKGIEKSMNEREAKLDANSK